jgi:ATP-dependent RNA helicase DDX52/ROK1
MDSVFSSLTSGVTFNRAKHGNSMKLFGKGSCISFRISLLSRFLDSYCVSCYAGTGEKKDVVNILDIVGGKDTSAASSSKKANNSSSSSSSAASHEDGAGASQGASFTRQDQINEFRNRLMIRVKGSDVPAPVTTFADMHIHAAIKPTLLTNIENSEWKEPTAIQMQAIPSMLVSRDVLAAAPTGSGKTAAYAITALSKVFDLRANAPASTGIKVIILSPTKELADQIHREVMRLSYGKKLKAHLLNKNLASLSTKKHDKSVFANIDILISTPLRLLSVIREDMIDLSAVQLVILDEVDKLFEFDTRRPARNDADDADDQATDDDEEAKEGDDADNGDGNQSSFLNQIDEILSHCTNERLQRALFSATIGPLVQNLANSVLKTPIQISIGVENSGASTINQKLIFVGREEGKLLGIRQLIQQGITPPVLIFMQSKDRAKELFLELVYDGIHVDVIHAERTAQQREEVIKQFRLGKIWVLICTDLMARGVDFKGVQMVINYDFPQSAVSYIHRIGRTGRAGRTGTAVTFFTEEDIPRLRAIANVMKLSGCEIPDWIMSIKQVVLVLTTFLVIVSFERSAQMSTKMKRKLRTQAPDRRSISTVPKFDRDAHAKKKQIVEQSKEKKARVRANSDDS